MRTKAEKGIVLVNALMFVSCLFPSWHIFGIIVAITWIIALAALIKEIGRAHV